MRLVPTIPERKRVRQNHQMGSKVKIMAKARLEELCQKIGDRLTVDRIHELTGGVSDEEF